MSRKNLIVSVHPDDETLGCGGTILKRKSNGEELYWMIITNMTYNNGYSNNDVNARKTEIEKVNEAFGFKQYYSLDFPPGKIDTISFQDIIKKITEVINIVKPHEIFLPYKFDVHTDHQHSFKAIYSCTKNFRFPFIKKILMCDIISETEFAPSITNEIFNPNIFIDVTPYFQKKLDIFKIYNKELMSSPLPRSIESLEAQGRYRGSRIGVKYAECFSLLLEII